MKIIQALTRSFTTFVERYYPDAFIFAIVLTLITFIASWVLTDASPVSALVAWGGGLSSLLAFMAQMALMLITSHALAHTDIARSLLIRLGRIPRTPFQTYFVVALISSLASLISWSFGLVAGTLVAVETAMAAKRNRIRVHYPLLIASAYAGFMVWHMGYSSSAALMVATAGNPMEEIVGGVIPVTETIFSSWNMLLTAIAAISIAFTCALMHPNEDEIVEAGSTITENNAVELEPDRPNQVNSFAERVDQMRWFTLVPGLLLILYLVHWFATRGLDLNFNIVIWTFLSLGLVLCRSTTHYTQLIDNAVRTTGPIMLQFPLYAGLMGLMRDTGLVYVISDWFTSFSTSTTLPFWAFISGGIINLFVPSGGGQFVIQGPIFFEAARDLGVDYNIITMAIAYGDQWTNTLQPFWTLPILAMAGLHMRQIMGFMFTIFIVTAICYGGGILIIAH